MGYGSPIAMLPATLEQDRKRAGWSVGRAASRLGVSLREHREIEAGTRSPNFETWDGVQALRLAQTFGVTSAHADAVPAVEVLPLMAATPRLGSGCGECCW